MKLMSIKEYAELEQVGIPAIKQRIRRGTLETKMKYDVLLIIVGSDKTIKKPRNGSKDN